MAVFAAFAASVGLRKLVERSLHSVVRTSPNALPAADLLLGFMVGVLTGASRMLHLERLRADSALRAMFGLTGFCLDDFNATEALLRVLCFTHNLIQLFQDGLGLRKADRPWREGPCYTLETLRNSLFTCAATLGARGRQSILRLSATPAWWHHFHQALARFLPDLPECRAMPGPRSFGPSHPELDFE